VSVDVSDLRRFQQRAHQLRNPYFAAWTGRVRRLGGAYRFELFVNGTERPFRHDPA
jgi:hypothetical protein